MTEAPSITKGFARTKEQRDALLAHGIPARAIFMEGAGAESLDACLATLRGRPGLLVIAHDLRLFGGTKRLVVEGMGKLEVAGIRVLDITHPEDNTVALLIHRAHVAISSSRLRGDRPRARRQGRQGGYAKGRAAQDARDGAAPAWLIDRIVDDRRIPWAVKTELLHPHFTKSTLRRHYGSTSTRR